MFLILTNQHVLGGLDINSFTNGQYSIWYLSNIIPSGTSTVSSFTLIDIVGWAFVDGYNKNIYLFNIYLI